MSIIKTMIIIFGLSTLLFLFNCNGEHNKKNYIVTVTGELDVEEIGTSLVHEHIVTDFIGAEKVKQPQYQENDAIEIILPHLKRLKNSGVSIIFECTPAYLGRDVKLLRRLSELSGIKIVTNTGYYAAVDKKYLPKHVYEESAEAIAKRWENEWDKGIDSTDIRPGFIKLGVGNGELDSIETKLLQAAIILSKKTGLTIAMHTGDGEAAKSEYMIIKKEGLKGDQMIWVHAQNGTDKEREELGNEGVWISLDGVSETKMQEYLVMINNMKKNNLLSKLLISQDDGWSVENVDKKIQLIPFGNGNTTPYYTIMNKLIDSLSLSGFSKAEIDQILIHNPKKAMAIKK